LQDLTPQVFQKKTPKTSLKDIGIAKARYKAIKNEDKS